MKLSFYDKMEALLRVGWEPEFQALASIPFSMGAVHETGDQVSVTLTISGSSLTSKQLHQIKRLFTPHGGLNYEESYGSQTAEGKVIWPGREDQVGVRKDEKQLELVIRITHAMECKQETVIEGQSVSSEQISLLIAKYKQGKVTIQTCAPAEMMTDICKVVRCQDSAMEQFGLCYQCWNEELEALKEKEAVELKARG